MPRINGPIKFSNGEDISKILSNVALPFEAVNMTASKNKERLPEGFRAEKDEEDKPIKVKKTKTKSKI